MYELFANSITRFSVSFTLMIVKGISLNQKKDLVEQEYFKNGSTSLPVTQNSPSIKEYCIATEG